MKTEGLEINEINLDSSSSSNSITFDVKTAAIVCSRLDDREVTIN